MKESGSRTRNDQPPESLGFRLGASSVHTSRTIMLAELALVFEQIDAMAKAADYHTAIVRDNILGKPTQTTRERTARRLVELYGLDTALPVFRLFRRLWSADAEGRPLLAYLAAAARDPLLRDATPFVLDVPLGNPVNATEIARWLSERHPARFKPTTLHSTAQNLASSWTQSGYLAGKVNKKRTRPVVTPLVATYALLLGYLRGLRGMMLLDTVWTRMLDGTPAVVAEFAAEASKQGWLTLKAAGAVVELTFPGLLTPQEERASHESH